MRPIRRHLGWFICTVFLVAIVGSVARSTRRSMGPGAPVSRPSLVSMTRSQQPPGGQAAARGKIVRDGIQVELEVTMIATPGAGPAGVLREGQDARIAFTIADTARRTPLAKLYPSAWAVARGDNAPPTSPRDARRRAESLINGGLFNRPELDLNVYYALTLNGNATISVVDPLFGFGGTKLLALVPLAARGEDWVLGPGGRQLFVALPDVNRVAIVDTQSWKVTADAPGGIRPHRMALQPDGRYLWIAGGAPGHPDSGVTALQTIDGKVAARIRTGRGRHDLALSDDSRFAFVTNSEGGSVSIIDVQSLREVATIPTGRRPSSIAYSTRARQAYVTDVLDGTISGIDPELKQVVNRVVVDPGLGQVRFSPSGSAGFVVNTDQNLLYVLDPASNRVVQRTKVEEGPDQVAFSNDFAYIRHRGSINVVMVSLKTAGNEGAPLSVLRFPAGERPPGSMTDAPPADSIVPAPGASAMLVANPSDKSVYYFKEGLAAPMGTFSNYKREPRAVLVLDRSLRERAQSGVYETVARLDHAGRFDLIFFLDQPRFVHAFPFEVQADADLERARKRGKVAVQPLISVSETEAGRVFRPLFELTDLESGGLKSGVGNLEILMFRVGGGWQDRRRASEVAAGVYGADFVPDQPGTYELVMVTESAGLSLNQRRGLTIRVVAATLPPPQGPRVEAASPRPATPVASERTGRDYR
jgi:YVTN family beta-propeller protein